jgi:digeranylgeranylglycerophospholipid reductase
VPLRQVYSCAQDLVEGLDWDPEAVGFWLGERWAPGGYAWIFPKGPGLANVGLGALPSKDGPTAIDLLDSFRADVAPNGRSLGRVVGGLPLDHRRDRLSGERVLLCGDAGRLADPLSGGGIANAMDSGRVAAEVLDEALADGDLAARRLDGYERRFRKRHPETTFHFVLGKILSTTGDETLERIVPLLKRAWPDGRVTDFDAIRLGARFLRETPSLLPVAARMARDFVRMRRRRRELDAVGRPLESEERLRV